MYVLMLFILWRNDCKTLATAWTITALSSSTSQHSPALLVCNSYSLYCIAIGILLLSFDLVEGPLGSCLRSNMWQVSYLSQIEHVASPINYINIDVYALSNFFLFLWYSLSPLFFFDAKQCWSYYALSLLTYAFSSVATCCREHVDFWMRDSSCEREAHTLCQ
jgi:hypothetical protein